MKSLIIGPNDAGQRMDKFLQKAVPLLPKALLYKYVRIKRIKRNGARCEIGTRLAAGDVIELYINDEFFSEHALPFLSAPKAITVVYEDDNILLVDKPVGLLVHEDDSRSPDTLIARIQHYLYDRGDYRPEEEHSFAPALCNRIDRNTAGIVIAAKNFETLQIIGEKMKKREITKRYLCLVHGTPAKKTALLKGYHTKDAASNQVTISDQPVYGAKTALTKYRVLATRGETSLLEIELLTGRTHQIRAHMATIGHPLVGDAKYGLNRMNRGSGMRYQALCSYQLTFSFQTPAGCLEYLSGQTFTVQSVPFLEAFGYSLGELSH